MENTELKQEIQRLRKENKELEEALFEAFKIIVKHSKVSLKDIQELKRKYT